MQKKQIEIYSCDLSRCIIPLNKLLMNKLHFKTIFPIGVFICFFQVSDFQVPSLSPVKMTLGSFWSCLQAIQREFFFGSTFADRIFSIMPYNLGIKGTTFVVTIYSIQESDESSNLTWLFIFGVFLALTTLFSSCFSLPRGTTNIFCEKTIEMRSRKLL